MLYAVHYASSLRCIGQALESLDLDIFELRAAADGFIVEFADPHPPYIRILQQQYSFDCITLLDRQGQTKRRQAKSEFRFDSLPETLRAAGKYIDNKRVQLQRLNNCSESPGDLEIQYQTRGNEVHSENLTTSLIREIAVSMYKQRTSIPNPIDMMTRHN